MQELTPGLDSADKIFVFLERQGGAWGARKDVIHKATIVIGELLKSLVRLELVRGTIRVVATFDEFNVDVDVTHNGRLIEFPVTRPAPKELLASEQALTRLSGYLIAQRVDRIRATASDDLRQVQFQLDH